MYLGNQADFKAAQLEDRLRDVLYDLDIGNGTPAADALSAALQLDLRISGSGREGQDRLLALNVSEIADLTAGLMWLVSTKHAEFELPLGTKMKSDNVGDFTIGGEHWILDAGRPGLHPMESLTKAAHGPNLDLLHSHIERLTRKLACRRIGLPSPVLIVDANDRHLLQFPPFAEAGEAVLQRWANGTNAQRFCSALPDQIENYAKDIVSDMRLLWTKRRQIAERVKQVRAFADATAAAQGVKVKKVSIDLHNQHQNTAFGVSVEYEALDEAMRIGTVLDHFPWNDTPEGRAVRLWGVEGRRSKLERLQALGADGWIDDMAAAVITVAPEGPAAVLAELAKAFQVTFNVPTAGPPMFTTLYWLNGEIKAEISIRGKLDWAGKLQLTDQILPESVISSLPGRRVDSVVSLPFACPCVILEAKERSGLVLDLEIDKRLVNCTTGAIWDEPSK
jgi:hypothetical protein